MDFLEHHRLFLADFLGVKERVFKDIRQQVDGHGQMIVGYLDVKRGQFFAGKGIHHTSDRIDG